ncbi:VOC family protein [Roseicyclus mahoneyensis]|uniref:Putative glyoxalase superfamily protein PhnB n=1 Tax=Roseicyclus mahoneyensis TaxID=164332 RepID=A0A316GLI0_9RHOB|nr:VOC family protein [Roseicyclus mahoneyensis]PWK62037.1 putative glyoxalase superfamily protein PhnB [Roseicyclus mahoneyensis]
MTEAPRIYPTFRYRDAAAMMKWLCDTVGFTVHARHPAEGDVAHAELAYGSSMIMIGAVRDDAYGALVGAPGQDGGKSIYVAVEDVDALHRRVAASGVVIEEGLVDRDHGSREFICRDPEGNLWCFGTYWPKTE